MSLLLAGLAQGIGSGLSAYSKQQADEQELTRKEQQAARSELVKELLQDKRLAAQEALTEKRLASQEKIAEQRNEQMLKQIEAGIIRSEIAAGASERAAQIRADATIRALMARDKAGSKPSAEDLKFARGIDAIAAKNEIEPELLGDLGRMQQTGQFTPRVAANVLNSKGLLMQDGDSAFVLGGDGKTHIPVTASDLPYLARNVGNVDDNYSVKGLLMANKPALDEYNNFRLNGGKDTKTGSQAPTVYQQLQLFKEQRAILQDRYKQERNPETKAKYARDLRVLEDGILAAQQAVSQQSGGSGLDALESLIVK